MRHRKIGGKFKKTVAVGLVVSMALGSATLRSFAKDVTEDTSTTSESDSSDKKESSVTSEEYSSESYYLFKYQQGLYCIRLYRRAGDCFGRKFSYGRR